MSMVVRVIKVLWFMFLRLVEYTVRPTRDPERLQARMRKDFLRWADYVLGVFTADLQVEGRENIPVGTGRKIVIVSNHQSQLDIPALVHAMQTSVGFVAKKELASIPLLNYWMRRIGCIFIDRSDRNSAHRALVNAAESMGTTPLVVFPEGTRSKDGKLLPAKIGGFRLALEAGALVLPVLLQNTRDAVENRAPGARRITARVRIFPAFDAKNLPEGKASLGVLKDHVEACWRS